MEPTYENGERDTMIEVLKNDVKEIKDWMKSTNSRMDKLFYLAIGSLFGLAGNLIIQLVK